MFTVGELKEFLKNLDDDAPIVLQVEHNNHTYIAMDSEINGEYDEDEYGDTQVVTIFAEATDIITPEQNEWIKSLSKKK